MKASTGWLSRKRRREAAYQRGYEAGLSAAKAPCEPIAYLRHGEETFVQNVPFGSMWISDKDDPRAFPVYDRPQEPVPFVAMKALELDGVPDALAYGKGIWRTCAGCHESNEGYPTGPASDTLKCHLGGGCFECGGIGAVWDTTDYEDMGNFIALSAQVQHVAGDQSRIEADSQILEISQRLIKWDTDFPVNCWNGYAGLKELDKIIADARVAVHKAGASYDDEFGTNSPPAQSTAITSTEPCTRDGLSNRLDSSERGAADLKRNRSFDLRQNKADFDFVELVLDVSDNGISGQRDEMLFVALRIPKNLQFCDGFDPIRLIKNVDHVSIHANLLRSFLLEALSPSAPHFDTSEEVSAVSDGEVDA